MKLFVAAIFAALAISTLAMPVEENNVLEEIDWANVVPIEEIPGFWEGREVGPAFYEYDGQGRGGRIIGGEIVTPGAHPYQAGLVMTTLLGLQGMCGGSIVNARTVLTAAHCPRNTRQTAVILGAHVLQANEVAAQTIVATSGFYRIHENYNPVNLNNDIAIIQLPSDITMTARRAPIVLALASAPHFAGAF